MHIEKIFAQFFQNNILLIGDVMVDSYLLGSVDRISPEAPVPIVSVKKRENRLGGAANVALNLQSLGANPIMCSVIGNDEKSIVFKKLLEENNLSSEGILHANDRKTTTKTRIISGSQHTLRVDDEITTPISEKSQDEIIAKAKDILAQKKIDAVIFQDYDKGVITQKVIDEIVAEARAMNIPTLVDPKKRNFNLYKNVTLFKPNFKELAEGIKTEISKKDFPAIEKLTKEFQKKQNIEIMFVTLSENGVLISDKEETLRIPAQLREIADVSGAGDTVISVATLCLVAGMSVQSIAEISNIAGGLVCEHSGVVPIDKNELMQEITRLYPQGSFF